MYFRIFFLALLLLFQFGCASTVTREVEQTQTVTAVEKPLPKPSTPLRQIPPPMVAIVVSSDVPAYREVAEELMKRLDGRARLFSLKGRPEMAARVKREIREAGSGQVVAVGLGAALVARELDKQLVFCQVFNYADHHLVGPNSKGVSLLPGLGKTFKTWKAISPNLADVGVISGAGFESMLDQASAAAARQGITLHHVEVQNDKEYQYAYKQMAGKVQGYWLLQDNRVLSRRILRDLMTFSVRRGKQVLVFSEELLRLGGLLSASSIDQDIANKVLDRLSQAAHKERIPGADIMPLDEVDLRINTVVAERLGLPVPEKYREFASAPDRQ